MMAWNPAKKARRGLWCTPDATFCDLWREAEADPVDVLVSAGYTPSEAAEIVYTPERED